VAVAFPVACDKIGGSRRVQVPGPGDAIEGTRGARGRIEFFPIDLSDDPELFFQHVGIDLGKEPNLVAAADVDGHDVSRDCRNLVEGGGGIGQGGRHHYLAGDGTAILLDVLSRGRSTAVAPAVVLGEQHNTFGRVPGQGVLEQGTVEVRGTGVEDELGAMGVFDGLGRRGRVGVDEDDAVLLADGRHARGNAGIDGSQHEAHLVPGDQLIRHLGGVTGIKGRVARNENDFAAQYAAARVEFVDGHLGAPAIRFGMQGEPTGGGSDVGEDDGRRFGTVGLAD